jgi:hypothetical protein
VVEVPEVSVENTPLVKVGLGVREMVEVEERRMLDPAVRYDTGELKKLFQRDVDAVSGSV